jgi:uridylate kinase
VFSRGPFVTTDYPAVQRALELDADALLVAKRGVDGVYDSDPRHNPAAVRRICEGADLGTRITAA